ncbi:DUF4169 family protein [Halovulum dunhuangense]|uniref:DUF4169 family protein n=1 Tax=Halovulum dunhuangense TaxID=1505036 RepID=A0A849L7A0_9RHOB|nr:DUF4169 family protein [Halovulum dunhuangense]NNU81941.1 DUF4169 family protein [Halovulum dunhuangense]
MNGGKVVNLKRARKQKARDEKRARTTATTPAVALLKQARAEKALDRARLDGHRVGPDDSPDED